LVFNCGSHTLKLGARTYIMGILNITPDSFFDGGMYFDVNKAVHRALEMVSEGADIIDIGAQSTRPGYTRISAEQEWERLYPVLCALKEKVDVPISIDTFYPEVADAAIRLGASIINDVSGSLENEMPAIAAKTGAGLILMHSGKGSDDTGNGSNAIKMVRAYFEKALNTADCQGLELNRICLDPGIGFGKDRHGDLMLVAHLRRLIDGLPQTAVMVGASRKRVIASCCDSSLNTDDRLAGTLALHTIAALNGAHILRVHDVAAAVQAARVTDALKKVGISEEYYG
jgi:dihydropteroate synthase